MQEYIFVHPEEWYSMSPVLRDLFGTLGMSIV